MLSRIHPSLGLVALLALGSGCAGGEIPAGDEAGETADSLSSGPVTSAETRADSSEDSNAESGEDSSEDPSEDSSDGTTGMTCGGQLYAASSIPSNILIVQDRSGSMDSTIDGTSKWEIAKAAIEQVVTDYGDEVFFGLMLYPGLDDSCAEGKFCGPGDIFVDVGPGTATDIIDALDGADTCSLGTPTAETLAPLRDYPGLEDPNRPNFILLITDGQSTCDDPVPEVEALGLEDPQIKTFVVGFGEGVDPSELDDMAEAGGTALPGDPKYYQASDAQALADAFADIAGNALSCAYVLDQVPPNPDDFYIYVDDVLIERDLSHMDGWDYDPLTNQITFYGGTCDQLQSGDAQDLEIIFGCPMIG